MPESIWPTIHAERRALADDLGRLTPEQWQTPSLCRRWTVHDVLAPQLSLARMTPPKFFVRLVAARFDFDRYAGSQAAKEGAGGPDATLAASGPPPSVVAHRPGQRSHGWARPSSTVRTSVARSASRTATRPIGSPGALGFYAGGNLIIGSKRRIDGLSLTATDADFTLGSGPAVSGTAIDLLLAVSGRSAACTDLFGPGLDVLAARP